MNKILNTILIIVVVQVIPFFIPNASLAANDPVPAPNAGYQAKIPAFSMAPVIQNVLPAVVNISVKLNENVENDPESLYQDLNKPPEESESQSDLVHGSGVIIDKKRGTVITNNHVVEEADKIYVTLNDGRRIKAALIGSDPETDIAVLRINAANLTEIPIGDSAHLQVGDFVIAIGNPFGLGLTATSGMVSALNRSGLGSGKFTNFIQTDAAINPGSSGGALIDSFGRLVGINTAIASNFGISTGIAFAIPVDLVISVMKRLLSDGVIERGYLGVFAQDLSPDLAEALSIKAVQGALIAQVIEGSSAENGGMKEGDLVVKVDRKVVANASDLFNAISLLYIGQDVEFEVVRGSAHIVLPIIMSAPGRNQTKNTDDQYPLVNLPKGIVVRDLPPNIDFDGVLVIGVEPQGAAAFAGIREGDVLISVNGKRVRTADQALKAAVSDQKSLLLNIRRPDVGMYILID